MLKFTVCVSEQVSYSAMIDVEAENVDEALYLAQEKYDAGEVETRQDGYMSDPFFEVLIQRPLVT